MIDEPSDPQACDADGDAEWFGFDTENDNTGKVTLTALVSESGDSTVWDRAGRFTEWVERRIERKQPATVICHNAEYDLVNELGRDKYAELGLNYLKGRLISAKWGCLRFLDSFNHFRMPLLDLGADLGIQKKAMDIHDPEYVKVDAWICLKAMTQARDYIASLGGKLGATSGASSLSVWKYMTDAEFFNGPHDTAWLRTGYYGGRTEIFRRVTDGPGRSIRGYDINSMYPFCMLNDFPEYFLPDMKLAKAKGMAEITVRVPASCELAPLCHRAASGQLLYPVGVFRGTWTYDEIRLAQSVGATVLKVHQAVGSNSLVRPFDQFITTLYAKRKNTNNSADRLFLKVLMNSLYGKIAAKNQVTRSVSRHQLLKAKSSRLDDVKWVTYHRGLLDYVTPQQSYVNVLWGSMITAYSRNLLFKWMSKVPPEKLIYCDTDSIYCVGYELPESSEIGMMKLEKRASYMKVIQPKAYQIDDFFRAKGVPRPRKDPHNPDGLVIDYARQYIEEGFTEFQAPVRFRASLNSKRGKANQWIPHSKSIKSAYSAKRLSGERYHPPVIGHQLELSLAENPTNG